MLLALILIALKASFNLALPLSSNQSCSPTAFSFPEIFGVDFIDIHAQEVYNYTGFSLRPGSSDVSRPTTSFCNVSVTYMHPGWNDTTHVSVWLPLRGWNGRLQALGGGGYSAGFGPIYLTQAVAAGYVAIDTDAGHPAGMAAAQSPSSWVLASPGNVNLYLLEDFATRSLGDMAIIGKSITQSYYGSQPKYSYFSGCSGGGRQGLEIAQKFSTSYDGILAVAPAINIEKFIPAGYWATQVMNTINYFPPPCEIDAFTQAAIDACDALDGLKDGIISTPQLCNFTANDVVGRSFSCNGTRLRFTKDGAIIVQAAWTGPRSPSGKIGWFGLSKDASLTKTYLATECPNNSTSNCRPVSSELISGWIKYFLARDPTWNASTMTNAEFFEYLEYSGSTYGMLSSSSPDLTSFRAGGGKMITWHGIADEVIPINGTIAYYQQVLANDPKAQEYFRFFEAPGVGHCIGGKGPIPNGAFDALVRWVEEEVVPEALTTVNLDGSLSSRVLCPYPSQQKYVVTSDGTASFECEDSHLQQHGDIVAQHPFSAPRHASWNLR